MIPAALHARFPHLRGDLRGAVASQLLGLPYGVTSGMLAFAPLGPAYLANGIAAGLASSAVAGIVTALVGGHPCQINGPRASVAVLMGGLIAAIANHAALKAGGTPDAAHVLGITMLCIALSGLLQLVFGMLRFGGIVRFLPYPVISGFMVALGMLVVLPQVPPLLGASPEAGWRGVFAGADLRWGAVLVGLATIAGFLQTRARYPGLPAPLIGMLAGTVLHYALQAAFGGDAVGMVGMDTLTGGAMPAHPWTVPDIRLQAATLEIVVDVLPIIATIAFIASLESLLSSSVLNIAMQSRSDSNRELLAQGASNIAVAIAGGAVSCGAPFRGVANYNAGGRTRLSGALHSAISIPLLLLALPALLRLPLAALASVLVVAGWDVITGWRKRLATCPKDDIAVGLLVMAATLALGTVPAIAVGVMAAMFLYVRNTSRSPIRAHVDGSVRLSAKVRNDEQTAFLRGLGSAIRIVEAQGSIFFGTADKFGLGVEALGGGCRHLVLDMKRVHEIDPTGALVLAQTLRRLAERGVKASIASITPGGRRGSVLVRTGVDKELPLQRWFADADRAVEQAEDEELGAAGKALHSEDELPLPAMDICRGMTGADAAAFATYLDRVELPAGDPLFKEGDPGDRMYLLARGEVTISVRIPGKEGRTRRLATYGPGVILGEMAVLEGQKRSADAVTLTDCALYALDIEALSAMQREAPALHSRFALNLARQVAVRLRATTLELRVAHG